MSSTSLASEVSPEWGRWTENFVFPCIAYVVLYILLCFDIPVSSLQTQLKKRVNGCLCKFTMETLDSSMMKKKFADSKTK